MTSLALAGYSTRQTPQSEPIPGTVPNSAGGHSFQVDQWQRLRRFLILGVDGGTYYATERAHTLDNVQVLHDCLASDPVRTVADIVWVSDQTLAPKVSPAIFALALAASHPDPKARSAALDALPAVCRTASHLLEFVGYVDNQRGWGRGLRRAVAAWYTSKTPDQLAYQAVKYRQRGKWSQRDVLRKAHPAATGAQAAMLAAIAGKDSGDVPEMYRAFRRMQDNPANVALIVDQITEHGLPWEAIPTEALASPAVWRALLPTLPITALTRNLGRMTANGTLAPMSDTVGIVVDRLAAGAGRIHPFQFLLAASTYRAGRGVRGGLTWGPIGQIVGALEAAYLAAFRNVEPSGKRTMLALDVSGSMDGATIAGTHLTAREGASAMAHVTLATEPHTQAIAFSQAVTALPFHQKSTLAEIVRYTRALPFSGTDCALPMMVATDAGIDVDTFVVYTDSETWAGRMHPVQALRRYREKSGIDARLVVVGMTSNGFTIADPADVGMLDVVGFDASAPSLIAGFAAGRV